MAVETHGLAKHFGSLHAVDGIDLAVPAGSTYGFLGPNGSGKTTTIRVLLGLVSPTAGSWSLLGQPMPERSMATLPHVGALVEGPAFYPWLSGQDNLARYDSMGPDWRSPTRAKRIAEALERVGLTAAARKKYRAYSLGMRQRLGLAWALLRPCQLLVLDEPTNGMDPQGTRNPAPPTPTGGRGGHRSPFLALALGDRASLLACRGHAPGQAANAGDPRRPPG